MWKVDSRFVRGQATEIGHREAIGTMRRKTSDRVHETVENRDRPPLP